MGFRENVWMSDYVKRGGDQLDPIRCHQQQQHLKSLSKASLFFSLSLSRKNNVNQIFNAGETKTNAGESKRELPTEKFTTISQERCLQFTTTNQETNNPKKCCCHFVSNALHSFLSFIERSLADVYSIDSSLLR